MVKYYIKKADWEKIYTFLKTILQDIRVENKEIARYLGPFLTRDIFYFS